MRGRRGGDGGGQLRRELRVTPRGRSHGQQRGRVELQQVQTAREGGLLEDVLVGVQLAQEVHQGLRLGRGGQRRGLQTQLRHALRDGRGLHGGQLVEQLRVTRARHHHLHVVLRLQHLALVAIQRK